jgi:hypothetical protein
MKNYFGANTFLELQQFGLTPEQSMRVHDYILKISEEMKYDSLFLAHCLTLQMLKEGKKSKILEVGST